MSTLPNKPSELMKVALDDFEKCESSEDYNISMQVWHITDAPKCNVCFAGAFLAKTIGVSDNKSVISPRESLHQPLANKMRALNCLSNGNLHTGLYYIELIGDFPYDIDYDPEETSIPKEVDVARYEKDPEKFKEDILKIINILKNEDL